MTDKPAHPKFTVLEGGKGCAKGIDAVPNADPVMSVQEARSILADPNVTLEMITQDVFNAIFDEEVELQQEQDALESGEVAPLSDMTLASVGHQCIDRIAASLAVNKSAGLPGEDDVRTHLTKLFKEYIGQPD